MEPRTLDPYDYNRALVPAEREAALLALKALLQQRFGERVVRVVLFGSAATGRMHADSDVDVLALVRDLTTRERSEVLYEVGLLNVKHLMFLSLHVMTPEHFHRLEERELLIAGDIARDGIDL